MSVAIKYCMEHDILSEFLAENSTEVFNMLITEWNTEDAKVAWFEEGKEEGKEEIALKALAKGYSINEIQDITGLDAETIRNLSAGKR